MKITDVRPFIVSAQNDNWVYVKVYTDEGFTGVGECSLETREQTVAAAVLELRRTLVGMDPLETEKIFYLCCTFMHASVRNNDIPLIKNGVCYSNKTVISFY